MKLRRPAFIVAAFAATVLAGCEREHGAPSSASADASKSDHSATRIDFAAPERGGSPHFEKIISRLDVGGKMIKYQDHEGRRDLFIDLIDAVIDEIPAWERGKEFDTAALLDALGFARSEASGRSLIKDGDSWLMRSYQYQPGGPAGLSRLLGNEPIAFASPALLPAATDLVIETRLDATHLPGLIQRICKAAGQAAAADNLLQEKLPIGGTVGDLMAKSDLHLILAADVSSWSDKPTLPKPVDFLVRIDGAADLLPLLLPAMEGSLGKPTAFGGRRGWELPLPAFCGQTTGVLLYEESGILLLASRKEYLESVDSAEMKLAGWEEYQKATDHFPASGNLLVYASPQVPVVVGWAVQKAAAKSREEAAGFIARATEHLQPRSYSLCIAYEEDGIALTAELPFAAEMDMASTLPMLSATSVLFVGARAWKKGSDRAACIMNVRNVQQAVRSHQNLADLHPGDPIPWDDIIGPSGYLPAKPSCIVGATYTFAATFPKVGELACTCSNPDHAVPDHSDW